jgi:hypothetical protein
LGGAIIVFGLVTETTTVSFVVQPLLAVPVTK